MTSIIITLLAVAPAQLPWSRVYVDQHVGSGAAVQALPNAEVRRYLSSDRTEVVVIARAPVSRVTLALDVHTGGEVLYPHLMGLRIDPAWLAARTDTAWLGMDGFPGECFAPLVVHHAAGAARMIADIEGRACRPVYKRNEIALEYAVDLQPGQTAVFRNVVARVAAPSARQACHALIAAYRLHFRDDLDYGALQWGAGYLNIQLQNHADPLDFVLRLCLNYPQFRRVQVWGWTSDRLDGTEDTSCCLKSARPHPRYVGLGELDGLLAARGVDFARYYRADDPAIDSYPILGPRYVDVAAFLRDVRRRYGPLNSTVVEGVSVACDHAGLIAGSITGGADRVTGRSRAYEQPAPWFGRLVFDRRPLFAGDSNFDWSWTTPDTKFRTYRQAFLLGCKFDWRGDGNPVVPEVLAEWERVRWWEKQCRYRDTEGISSVPAGLDVRRFVDRAGKTVLAADQWDDPQLRTILVDDKPVVIPARPLCIVEVP